VRTLLAPAKINLTLEVLARRDDGYHGVRSVMVPIGLFDRITVEPAARPSFSCDETSLERDNLVARALLAAGCEPCGVALEKRIPFGAGLGGGSSDAAAILRAAMEGAIGRSGDPPDWLGLARSLGSDVPFFLVGTGALVEGTGERVTAVGALPPWWCVVAKPTASVATVEAYGLLDTAREAVRPPSRPRSESASLRAVEALQRGDLADLRRHMGNDFHDAICSAYPAIARARARLAEAGGAGAMLTGSGSCVFALFEGEVQARAVAARLRDPSIDRVWAVPLAADASWRTAEAS